MYTMPGFWMEDNEVDRQQGQLVRTQALLFVSVWFPCEMAAACILLMIKLRNQSSHHDSLTGSLPLAEQPVRL